MDKTWFFDTMFRRTNGAPFT